MKIEYLHASKYGNGAMVAEEFSKQMAAKGWTRTEASVGAALSAKKRRRDGRRSGWTACARKHGCHSSRERPRPVTIGRG
jgi:hypothetical protein